MKHVNAPPDLPTGYKDRMDREVMNIMPAAARVMEICDEFCGDSVEITDGSIIVRLTRGVTRNYYAKIQSNRATV